MVDKVNRHLRAFQVDIDSVRYLSVQHFTHRTIYSYFFGRPALQHTLNPVLRHRQEKKKRGQYKAAILTLT
jgi:hypothetical protein